MEDLGVAERSNGVRDQRMRIGPTLAVTAASVALGGRFFLVIWRYAINVFYYDQWQYLTSFFRHQPSITGLFFLQHGPHREGIGLIADKFLYPLTHWNARVDAYIIGGSIFAAMLLALRLKCRLYGGLSYSDIAIPVIFLTLAQFELVIAAPNPASAGLPLLLIMLYCLALLSSNRLRRYSLVLALNFLLIYTGYGVLMGVVTLGVFLLECYWSWRGMSSVRFWQALTGFLVATTSLASFFVHYTFSPGDCFEFSHRHGLQYLRFMSLMFASFAVPRPLVVSTGMTVLGVAILLGVVVLLVWHLLRLLELGHSGTHLVGAVLVGYSLLFSVHCSIGRLCLGLAAAFGSRYVTLLIPAFLAIYFYLLSKPWCGQRNLVLALWVVLLVPGAVHKPQKELRWYSNGKRDWANCYVRTENIHYCNQNADFLLYPPPEKPDFQQELDYLKQHRLNLFDRPGGK